MKEKLQELYSRAITDIEQVNDFNSLQNVRNTYLSKKSELNGLMSKMRDLSPDERASFGQLINKIKSELTEKIENKRKEVEEKDLSILASLYSVIYLNIKTFQFLLLFLFQKDIIKV